MTDQQLAVTVVTFIVASFFALCLSADMELMFRRGTQPHICFRFLQKVAFYIAIATGIALLLYTLKQ